MSQLPSEAQVMDFSFQDEYLTKSKEISFLFDEKGINSDRGLKIIANLENLISCNNQDFLKYYEEAIQLDPGILGVRKMLYQGGLYGSLCRTIDKRMFNRIRPDNPILNTDWEKETGIKIYQLLLRVEKLPNTPKFNDAKVRIYQGAGRRFNDNWILAVPDYSASTFVEANKQAAMDFFKTFFENK